MNKEKLHKELIKAYKEMFNLYPNLTKLPVYAWGRRCKYENAGSAFEYTLEDGARFHGLAMMCNYNKDYFSKSDIKLLKKIDKIENSDKGKLYTGEIGDFVPDRESCVKAYKFDDRYGQCLVIEKNNGKLSVNCIDCDSPE